MPIQDIIQYSTTAGSNTTIGTSISTAENCPIANWNNAVRELMANLATRLGSSFSLADSATPALGDQEEEYGTLLGTTAITAFGTPTTAAGKFGFEVVFADVRTLTHNGTSLILPGGANITTAAGDMARFRHEGSGSWRCLWYTRSDGTPVVGAIADLAVTAQKLAIKGSFQPYAKSTPDMQITLAEGSLLTGGALTRVASQNTGTITAPAANPRKDIVYVDAISGVIGVATGAENVSPVDPTVPAGKIPVARLRLATSTTSITNSLIDDIRGLPSRLVESSARAITTSSTDTFAHGLGVVPSEFGAYLIADVSAPELGYSAGQRIDVMSLSLTGIGGQAKSLYADATNVNISWGSSANTLLSLSTFALVAMDYTKWTVVLWAKG